MAEWGMRMQACVKALSFESELDMSVAAAIRICRRRTGRLAGELGEGREGMELRGRREGSEREGSGMQSEGRESEREATEIEAALLWQSYAAESGQPASRQSLCATSSPLHSPHSAPPPHLPIRFPSFPS